MKREDILRILLSVLLAGIFQPLPYAIKIAAVVCVVAWPKLRQKLWPQIVKILKALMHIKKKHFESCIYNFLKYSKESNPASHSGVFLTFAPRCQNM